MNDAPSPPAIRAVNLTCHYGVKPVLRDLSLDVPAGEILAVMGGNAAGKSTLLAAMAGVVSPWRGFVEVLGNRRRDTPASELAARQACCYLPAAPYVAPGVTARGWVVACGRVWGVEDRRLMDHAARLLALFDLNPDLKPADASTGQRHKIALAGALASDAPVLILDEPFGGGLDPSGIVALREVLLDAARRRGRTTVMATPVPSLVQEMADRVAVVGAAAGLLALDTPAGLMRRTDTATLEAAYGALTQRPARADVAGYLRGEGAAPTERPR